MIFFDRIEQGTAVLYDDDKRFCVPVSLISPLSKEGDVLLLENGLYRTDTEATTKIRNENNLLLKKLTGKK